MARARSSRVEANWLELGGTLDWTATRLLSQDTKSTYLFVFVFVFFYIICIIELGDRHQVIVIGHIITTHSKKKVKC